MFTFLFTQDNLFPFFFFVNALKVADKVRRCLSGVCDARGHGCLN